MKFMFNSINIYKNKGTRDYRMGLVSITQSTIESKIQKLAQPISFFDKNVWLGIFRLTRQISFTFICLYDKPQGSVGGFLICAFKVSKLTWKN